MSLSRRSKIFFCNIPWRLRGGVEVWLYSFFNLGARLGRVVNVNPPPPDRPACSDLLYQLPFPGHQWVWVVLLLFFLFIVSACNNFVIWATSFRFCDLQLGNDRLIELTSLFDWVVKHEVELFLHFIKHHGLKKHEGMEVQLSALFTSTLGRGEWSGFTLQLF